MEKKERGDGVAYARKEDYEWEGTKYEADIQNGDKVTIKDAGIIEESQWGPQKKFLVSTRNGDKRVGLNQASENILIDAFGDESEKWIGKEVNVLTRKAVIANKRVIVAYFVPSGWSLDEYGELISDAQETTKKNEYPDEEINPDDIPF